MGLKVLVHDCLRLSSFRDGKCLLLIERGPKKATKVDNIVDVCAQVAASGLKPPIESPHLDFPD